MYRILFVLLLSPFISFGQEKFIKKEIADFIQIRIPESFINMGSNERIRKYVSNKAPLAVFTSEDRFADLGVNLNPMQWTEKDTKTVYGFYKASINSLFDEITFIQDTIKKINNKEFIVFEFESVLRDDNVFKSNSGAKNYTYIQYTSYNNQVLLFNFGCPGRQKQRYEKVAQKIMESVVIK